MRLLIKRMTAEAEGLCRFLQITGVFARLLDIGRPTQGSRR
jgi:hypothetical protein